jgi:hypothetical protein
MGTAVSDVRPSDRKNSLNAVISYSQANSQDHEARFISDCSIISFFNKEEFSSSFLVCLAVVSFASYPTVASVVRSTFLISLTHIPRRSRPAKASMPSDSTTLEKRKANEEIPTQPTVKKVKLTFNGQQPTTETIVPEASTPAKRNNPPLNQRMRNSYNKSTTSQTAAE